MVLQKKVMPCACDPKTLAHDTATLPTMIAQQFQSEERFVVLHQDDTIMLKRVTTLSPVERANMTPDPHGVPSLEEIDDLVHDVRRARRGAQRE